MMQEPQAALPLRKRAATLALRRRFAALRPDLELSPAGRVARIEDNLLPGVEARHFVEDLKRGDGNELKSKFRAVHSSAALVVNSFARFKDEPAHLTLAEVSGFETLAFERVCPTGVRAPGQPNLDLLAEGPAGVVAVESKLTEPLQPTAPCFSPKFAEQIRDERRGGVWFRAMETVLAEPDSFSALDVAQLIKHALPRAMLQGAADNPPLSVLGATRSGHASASPRARALRPLGDRRLSHLSRPELSGTVVGVAGGDATALAQGASRQSAGTL